MVGLVGGYAFLMKAEWNNYAEGNCLKEAVEEYRQTFGFYPKTILADRAYPVGKTYSGVHRWGSGFPDRGSYASPPLRRQKKPSRYIVMAVSG